MKGRDTSDGLVSINKSYQQTGRIKGLPGMGDNKMMTRKERKQLFIDAVRRNKKPERIPLLSFAFTWKIIDSPYSLSEAMLDYDKLFDVCCRHHEKYQFDAYIDMGIRNPMRLYEALGQTDYVIDDEKQAINYHDVDNMVAGDLDKIIDHGLYPYFWEDLIVKKYRFSSKEDAFEKLLNTAKEIPKLFAYLKRVSGKFLAEYQVPNFSRNFFDTPFDDYFCSMRGMKGTAMDLRRHPEKLAQILDLMWEKNRENFQTTLKTASDDTFIFDYATVLMGHNLLRVDQFEKYMWKYLELLVEETVRNDKNTIIIFEGEANRFYDYLKELPRGHFAVLFETDDYFAAKKILGDKVTLVGGFPTALLNNGTKQECIDYAKRVIEELAYDGAYIYSQDKMLSFSTDGKPENIKAVNDFMKEQGSFS